MDNEKIALLKIVGFQLFGGERPNTDVDLSKLLNEAKVQTVYNTVFLFLQDILPAKCPNEFEAFQEEYFRNVIINTNNFQEHSELNELMNIRNIPYTVIKGLSSAYYYPDPSLRNMGDVDYLVYEKDFNKAKNLVLSDGFVIDHGDNDEDLHIAFNRKPMSIWEQHRSVNGIPAGEKGRLIKKEIDSTIETASSVEIDGAVCRIPDKFHHGIIILLHMISHMTSEGIGLRHLCDWAVFSNGISNNDFKTMFEEKLKLFGLWKFAQIITAVCEKYLGTEHKEWSENERIKDEFLKEVIEDILSGGNFGKKDLNRYREIKYISNRNEGTVDNKNVIVQVAGTLNKKVYSNYGFIDKYRVFLPLGWVFEGGKYIKLLITGKRKSANTSSMLKEAAKRKDIYSKMDLFK